MDAERVVEVFTSEKWKTYKYWFLAGCIGSETGRSIEEQKEILDTLIQMREILFTAYGIDPKDYDRVCQCIKILESDLAKRKTMEEK